MRRERNRWIVMTRHCIDMGLVRDSGALVLVHLDRGSPFWCCSLLQCRLSKLGNMFILVALDKHTDDLHQRCQRMRLVLAYFVNQLVKDGNKASVVFL